MPWGRSGNRVQKNAPKPARKKCSPYAARLMIRAVGDRINEISAKIKEDQELEEDNLVNEAWDLLFTSDGQRRVPPAGAEPQRTFRKITDDNGHVIRRKLVMGRKLPAPATFLHMLPGEIRNTIYDYLLAGDQILPRQRYIGGQRTTVRIANLHLNFAREPVFPRCMPAFAGEYYARMFANARCSVDMLCRFPLGANPIGRPMRHEQRRNMEGDVILPVEQWIANIDPAALKFREVVLRLWSVHGSAIGEVIMKYEPYPRGKKADLYLSKVGMENTRWRMEPARLVASWHVRSLKEKPDFNGFSLDNVQTIAQHFDDPEHRFPTKEVLSNKSILIDTLKKWLPEGHLPSAVFGTTRRH